MTRIGTLRETFDREMDFVAVRPLKFNGRMFTPGQGFDKSVVTTRRLRQLYDTRYLRMVEPEEPIIRQERPRPVFELGNNIPPEEFEPAKPVRVKRVKSSK